MRGLQRRAVIAGAAMLFMSACGQPKTVDGSYEQASSSCKPNVIARRFVVRLIDGTRQVVRAASEAEFKEKYLQPNLASVDYAEPDYRIRAIEAKATVTYAFGSTTIDNWGARRIAADTLWAQGVRGANVKIAVVDTGLDTSHPQFQGQLLANPGETGRDARGVDRAHNGIDDDGNGLIDDAQGWDYVGNQPLVNDNSHHGSHVGGIIAAAHADTQAGETDHVQGIAPEAKILPLAFLDGEGAGAMSDAVKAIDYAVRRGANVINASWGGTQCSRSLRDTIAALDKRGVIFVAAAGNDALNDDTAPEYPAALNLASQITVGATGELDYKAEYSNYGLGTVHIFAPGSDIMSTLPGSRVGSLSGTSMATPFVTGAVALLLSAVPNATAGQIRQALYTTALRRNDYLNASHGRIDLTNALAELQRLSPIAPK